MTAPQTTGRRFDAAAAGVAAILALGVLLSALPLAATLGEMGVRALRHPDRNTPVALSGPAEEVRRLLRIDAAAQEPLDPEFTAPPPAPVDMTGMTLVFHDEFDRLDLYDPARGAGTWKTSFIFGKQTGPDAYESRTLSGSDDSIMIYVDKAFPGLARRPLGVDPFSVRNGVLTITARRIAAAERRHLWDYRFTSGLITTEKSFRQTYGYYEIRAKVPLVQGAWPAFWLLPTDSSWPPEIDILEQIGGRTVFFSKHSKAGGVDSHATTPWPLHDAEAFHTYGLLWTASTLTWYLDGRAVAATATPSDMTKPMYLLANLAMGGRWPGNPDPRTASAAFQIDYIRAYSLPPDRIGTPNPGPSGR